MALKLLFCLPTSSNRLNVPCSNLIWKQKETKAHWMKTPSISQIHFYLSKIYVVVCLCVCVSPFLLAFLIINSTGSHLNANLGKSIRLKNMCKIFNSFHIANITNWWIGDVTAMSFGISIILKISLRLNFFKFCSNFVFVCVWDVLILNRF